ncbi:ribonuclease H [Halobacterium bonnevillei]|uniref:Ribonuclease H n=1 Tax=Halobacterium bonnevillei TaxID=2692200 RepID=A0A6B0SKF4_9EURY|nr:ribonuclease H [Halobacterium bonnevillei]MXR20996.1 ribonuclease H [Halobacterium bonnevillei]
MAIVGRSNLRDLFDDAPTPHIAHPPESHRRDFYVATDGSYSSDGSGLGVIVESRTGDRIARLAVPDEAPNNNVAEYRALHLGLDVLAARAPSDARVGILVDHNDLAGDVNTAVLAARAHDYRPITDFSPPAGAGHHWRGIRARVVGFEAARAAQLDSNTNPAHVLANEPEQYAHVNDEPARCLVPAFDDPSEDPKVPPPSRSDRRASD